ncbi:MAG: hypothetical protein K2G10_00610, partial [Alistipes sp.]|nr:hypothetical protein [Alistipes sp.]
KNSFCYSFQRLLHAPASGFRNNTTGALAEVGTGARYWTSAPASASSANGGFLSFTPDVVQPQSDGVRSVARTVRCVQHLQAAFSK